VLGEELDRISDSALARVAEQTTVFARVSPAQKNRIIIALKNRGHVVGFLGDGINDVPSLHAADVGISVATAVDVAKDAAEIILLERSLRVLHSGIGEGRRAFGNVMKYLLMGTSSNFGNMFSMAGASLFLPFLPMLPTQILLNNFLYDLAQVTIPTDNVDRSFIRKPRRWDIGIIRKFMLYIGPISSVYDFLTFYIRRMRVPLSRGVLAGRHRDRRPRLRGPWSPVLCVKRQDFASKPCHLQACNKCHNPWREKHQHGKVLHF
jgi:Mg2+-importing ATPase